MSKKTSSKRDKPTAAARATKARAKPAAPSGRAKADRDAKPAARTRAKARVEARANPGEVRELPPREQPPQETTTSRAGLLRVLREDGTIVAANDSKLPPELVRHLYETMVLVREFDRRMLVLQRQGRIGFYGPILGQEAATVGSVAALEDRDWIFPALREGAAALMRGLPLHLAIAQLIGNDLDRCRGRQMPCHYTFREGRYHAMSSVIGTQISHAVGAAMAAKLRKDDVVIAGYLGDGATSSNDFHCGMNFAAVFKAPVVLICQNNQWAISVPLSQQSASETLAMKADAYGMPSMRVDGNDVLAVYVATREAAARARRGEGPTFLELVTYRRLGHSSSDDPSRYRDEAEVAVWEKRDPIERLRRYLESHKGWDRDREQDLQDRIARDVNEAIRAAESAHPVSPQTLITDVFATPTPQLTEQLRVALGD